MYLFASRQEVHVAFLPVIPNKAAEQSAFIFIYYF
jgi:hypothetical protein